EVAEKPLANFGGTHAGNIARPRTQLKGSSTVTDLGGGWHLAFRNRVFQPERTVQRCLQQLEAEMRGRDVPRRDRLPRQMERICARGHQATEGGQAAPRAGHPYDGALRPGALRPHTAPVTDVTHDR